MYCTALSLSLTAAQRNIEHESTPSPITIMNVTCLCQVHARVNACLSSSRPLRDSSRSVVTTRYPYNHQLLRGDSVDLGLSLDVMISYPPFP